MQGGGTTRAWSITGPYGSGKSSLGLLLGGLAAPLGSSRQVEADRVIRSTEPALADEVIRGRDGLGARDVGLTAALVTADHAPIEVTIARALLNAAADPDAAAGILSTPERELLEAARLGRASPGEVFDILVAIARRTPLLVVIDEFGKTLEHHARTGIGDSFLLQRIAEAGAGRHALPIFLFTLQHLAYSDYVGTMGESARREWAKVQGRFEDVAYAPSRDEMVTLVRRGFEPRPTSGVDDRIRAYARQAAQVVADCGLDALLTDTERAIAETFPLHPLALLGVPELCRSHGQFERSLFSFLASDGAGSVSDVLASPIAGDVPTVGLAAAYDYFVGSARAAGGQSTASARWLEVEARVREASGLSKSDLTVLKTVATLNLVSTGGPLRASSALVGYALTRPDLAPDIDSARNALTRLEAAGLVTYRAFADEYRIWQGSDFDVAGTITRARSAIVQRSPASIVAEAIALEPVVALKHAHETGIHRYFQASFGDTSSPVEVTSGGADGRIVFWLDEGPPDPLVSPGTVAVIVRPSDVLPLVDACVEAAAIHHVLSDSVGTGADWVARRELTERLAGARAHAFAVFRRVFDPGSSTVAVLGAPSTGHATRWSRVVSDVCDVVFADAPRIRSEMLARDDLTTQAAKARGELVAALIGHSDEPALGLTGYGPERAFYEALIANDFHRQSEGGWRLAAPKKGSSFWPLWKCLNQAIDGANTGITAAELEDLARAAPFGLPRSVFPIMLTTILKVREDDVAVFQDDTYQPVVSLEIIERLTRAPARFRVRTIGSHPAAPDLLAALGDALGITPRPTTAGRRNGSVLAIVGPLLASTRELPPYAISKRGLSANALAVRERLLAARDPGRLIFDELPVACGLEAFGSVTDIQPWIAAYAGALAGALRELSGAYRQLLRRLATALARELGCSTNPDKLRTEAQTRAGILRGRVFEPRLRALVSTLADQELEDDDWLAAVAMTVVGPPPRNWRDEDEVRYDLELRRLVRSLEDTEALHFESIHRPDTAAFARRVTVSDPDGSNWHRTVWLDESEDGVLGTVVDELRTRASKVLGRQADDALLAVLADRIATTSGAERPQSHPLPPDEGLIATKVDTDV